MLAAHDAVTTNSRKAQQKLGKLVDQGWHAALITSLEELPVTASPPGPSDPQAGTEIKAFAKARCRSLQRAGATACLQDEANGLTPCYTRSIVRGLGKCVSWG